MANAGQLVSVVIPTCNRMNMLMRCLDSVLQSDYGSLEVIVVDDFSNEPVADEVRGRFPQVRVIRNERRVMLSASRNAGYKAALGEYIFFLDDDNVIDSRAISEMTSCLETSDVAVAAPVIYYLGQPDTIWYAGSWMSPLTGVAVFPRRGSKRPPSEAPFSTVLFHDAFMVRRTVFDRIGSFDVKNFPIYLSEADLAERMKLAGMRVSVVPTAKVWHDIEELRGFRTLLRHMHVTVDFRAFYVARNRIIFMKKYRSVWQRLLFFSVTLPMLSLLHILVILQSSSSKSRAYLIRHYLGGLVAGLRG